MKKINIITIVAVCFTLFSCQKNDEYSNLINQLNSTFDAVELSNFSKNMEIDENIYDSAGIIHNLFLESILHDSILHDTNRLISVINQNNCFSIENLMIIRNIKNNYYNRAFDRDGNFKYSFFEFLRITPIEKYTLSSYFSRMDKCSNLAEKLAISRAAESFILSHQEYSSQEKQRLLSTMSIYRYSSIFWNQNLPDNMDKSKFEDVYNKFDALGEYIAKTQDEALLDDYGISIQDGKDIYKYSGLVSLSAAVFFTFTPYWIY